MDTNQALYIYRIFIYNMPDLVDQLGSHHFHSGLETKENICITVLLNGFLLGHCSKVY
jgi:hypothetical protein